MPQKTKIEWTDYTSNPIYAVAASGKRGWYCTKVSPGCLHCYSEALNRRWGSGLDYSNANRDKVEWKLNDKELRSILKLKGSHRIFIGDMTDLFHEDIPAEYLDQLFAVMALCPQHTFQILTKRPQRMYDYIASDGRSMRILIATNRFDRTTQFSRVWPLPNVWLGVSVENERYADERIPILLNIPAAVRFLSCEPLLSSIDLSRWIGYNPVYEEKHQRTRKDHLSGDTGQRTGNRFSGAHLENCKENMGSVEEKHPNAQVQPDESGTSNDNGLFAGSGNVRQDSLLHLSPSVSIHALQRRDTRRDDHKPQERDQARQQTSKPRTNDPFGAEQACASDIEKGTDRSMGEQERYGEANSATSKRHSDSSFIWRESNEHSQRLSNSISACVGHSKREAQISWIIIGAESGAGARPMQEEWARTIKDQAVAANVKVFYKQDALRGKKISLPILDGRQWMEFPESEATK